MIYLKAFVVGGLICTLVQIFLDNTKLMPGRVMVLLVIAGVILGAAGLYEPLIKWAGCGASVPLSGFGYNLSKGVIEAVKEEGAIGLFNKFCTYLFLYSLTYFPAKNEKIMLCFILAVF